MPNRCKIPGWVVRRGRTIVSTIAVVSLAGCTSPTQIRWPVSATAPGEVTQVRNEEVRREPPPVLEPTTDRAAGDPMAASIPAAVSEYPIDMTTALRLAAVENPVIAETYQHVLEALAIQTSANVLLLPSLNAGFNYHGHTGNLQRSSGRILNLSEQSLYFGGGAGVAAAGTVGVPAVSIYSHFTDAIFEPLAAHREVDRARYKVNSTSNDILREVAELYCDLLAAEAELNYRRLTTTQAREVERLTRNYAEAGQNLPAEAHRSLTELLLIEQEVRKAEENRVVASTRLVHRLHLDPNVRLNAVDHKLQLYSLVDSHTPLESLIGTALQRRPELGERSAEIGAAEMRVKQEVFRPLLPILQLGFSGGAFGGGSNLTPPTMGNFSGRTDFDVALYWTVQNFGFGNFALQKRRRAEVGQAVGDRSKQIAEIRAQVAAAYADLVAARQRVELTNRQLTSAEAGFREDLDRIRNTVGRPIEVVNSLRLLNQARVDLIRAITDHNRAQIRLFVSLGSPPPLARPATDPIPPAPIASPPVSTQGLQSTRG